MTYPQGQGLDLEAKAKVKDSKFGIAPNGDPKFE